MKHQHIFLFLGCMLLSSMPLFASGQEEAWRPVVEASQRINSIGMQVLLVWAGINLLSGSFGYFRSSGKAKYFHQMNAIWNLVNAALAIWALMTMGSSSLQSLQEAYRSGMQMEQILLTNAGLDLAYIAGGAFLLERGRRKASDRMSGYGPSIILQGGFLLLLDLVLFTLNEQQNEQLDPLLDDLASIGSAFPV